MSDSAMEIPSGLDLAGLAPSRNKAPAPAYAPTPAPIPQSESMSVSETSTDMELYMKTPQAPPAQLEIVIDRAVVVNLITSIQLFTQQLVEVHSAQEKLLEQMELNRTVLMAELEKQRMQMDEFFKKTEARFKLKQ